MPPPHWSACSSAREGLPSSTSELLLLAALDGTGDLRLIRRIADGREGQGLAPAERAHLVRADNTTERLLFRHQLIRSAVVDLSTSDQRRRAHRDLVVQPWITRLPSASSNQTVGELVLGELWSLPINRSGMTPH